MTSNNTNKALDYRVLGVQVGIIALALLVVVSLFSSTYLISISASYWTESRDAFAGMLFVVGALMWAYNGHAFKEALASKVAAVCAVGVALFLTACDTCIVWIVVGKVLSPFVDDDEKFRLLG